jgi:hypothetical protein
MGIYHFGYLGMDLRIILRWILRKFDVRMQAGLRVVSVVEYCEHGINFLF